jgi:large subunit ribosomal protein L10
MAVTRQQKNDILADLTAKFKEAKSIGFATSNTMTVAEFGDLRNSLREVDATYTLAKKTLMKIALKDALGIEVDLSDLPGQIGAVCSNDDAMAGLGKVNDLVTKTKGIKVDWAVSVFEGELKDLDATKVIAGMPSRDTLLGRLVGSMQSPLSGLARFFDAAAKELETQGKETVGKLEGEAKVEEKAPEAPAAEEKKDEAA